MIDLPQTDKQSLFGHNFIYFYALVSYSMNNKNDVSSSVSVLKEAVTIATLIIVPITLFVFILPSPKDFWGAKNYWSAISWATFLFVFLGWLIALVSPQRRGHLKFLKYQVVAWKYREVLHGALATLDRFLSKRIDRKKHPFAWCWSMDFFGVLLSLAPCYIPLYR